MAGESDIVLRKGDMIRDDYIAYATQGYPGHQSRNAILGKPTADQAEEYEKIRSIYEKTLNRCQPGIRCGDIFEFVVDEFNNLDGSTNRCLLGTEWAAGGISRSPLFPAGATSFLRRIWYLQSNRIEHTGIFKI